MARRAVEASRRGEPASTLELLRRCTARADTLHPEKPRVLAGANDVVARPLSMDIATERLRWQLDVKALFEELRHEGGGTA